MSADQDTGNLKHVWSGRYRACVVCGTDARPHLAKGRCTRCYQREYRKSHPQKGSRGRGTRFSLRFGDNICTPKKLIPMVLLSLYAKDRTPFRRKVEKAKDYIKRCLCDECRDRYADLWTNDLVHLRTIMCDRCILTIINRLDRARRRRSEEWMIKMLRCLKYKRKAIQYELELRSGRPLVSIFREWYVKNRMSSIEVQEHLLSVYRLPISTRNLQGWICELGIARTHVEALRNRVVTGRMDYSRRRSPVKRLERSSREQPSGNGKPESRRQPKRMVILVPQSLKGRIKILARRKGQTMSELVRDMFRIYSKTSEDQDIVYWRRLQYVVDNHLDKLMRTRRKMRRGKQIILVTRAPRSRGSRGPQKGILQSRRSVT